MKRVRRSKETLEMDVFKAIESISRKKGFSHISLMDIANESNTDINVLRRNFGSLEKLLDKYVHSVDYWLRDLLDDKYISADVGKEELIQLILKLSTFLYDSEEMQRLLVWQITEDNLTTRRMAKNREIYYKDIINKYADIFSKANIPVSTITGFIIAGTYFLILNRKYSTFCNIDYDTEEGKESLKQATSYLIEQLFATLEEHNKILEIAIKMKLKGLNTQLIAECTGLSEEEIKNL